MPSCRRRSTPSPTTSIAASASDKDQALWRGQNLPFQVEFFPRGFLYREAVDIFEVEGGQATRVPLQPRHVRLRGPRAARRRRSRLRRLPHPRADQPARLLRRGLRLPRRQLFPRGRQGPGLRPLRARARDRHRRARRARNSRCFRAFWLERPQPGVNSLVIHALLDSQSATGAYRFTMRPGDETVFDVESVLYPRATSPRPASRRSPACSSSTPTTASASTIIAPPRMTARGCRCWTGRSEQIWRPLANPRDLQFSAFVDTNPHGFGLLQRKRAFADYQDLEAALREAAEPVGRADRRLGPGRGRSGRDPDARTR